MRSWGPRSQRVRNTLCTELQAVCDFILANVSDVSLIDGHRNEAKQNAAYGSGNSQVKWPDGKHNKYPSQAVDLQPYPYPEDESQLREQLAFIAGFAIQWADQYGITLRWGGDWNRNGLITDNDFDDLFHFEVLNVEEPDSN